MAFGEDRKPDLSQADNNEEPQQDVKPDINEKMSIHVEYQGQQLKLQLKQNTPLRKVFEAAAKKFNKDLNALRFVYDGNRVQPDDTPAGLEMEDGDSIDAHLEQLGGGLS